MINKLEVISLSHKRSLVRQAKNNPVIWFIFDNVWTPLDHTLFGEFIEYADLMFRTDK